MLEAAARLMQRDGYAATSWRAIVEDAGTPWGSAHHYFPDGKEVLATEALALGDAEVRESIARCIEHTASAGDAVRELFSATARSLRDSDYRRGCPLATVALETAPDSTALTETCSAAFHGWEQQLSVRLQADGVPRKRARELATIAIATFEGALLLARVRRRIIPLTIAGGHLGQVFDAEASRSSARGG
jgi:TetR/AcrR family transcriptional repressor of lmrAB and yxaGH operons